MESEAEAMLKGQAQIWKYMFSFADSMALKCAVELHIADIIHSHGGPITLAQIVSSIPDALSPDIMCLARVMRHLVYKNIFTEHQTSDGGESLYGLTPASKWILRDTNQLSLAPMLMMENHPWALAPWHCMSQCVKEGGIAFRKAHGKEIWDFGSENPEFNKVFNDGMECTSKVLMRAILSEYKDGFWSIGSLVDVGGGIGGSISEIVKSYPHIKGINYDLPHVVSTAPDYPGVSHVGGDMFEEVPKADAVFMKWVMHDWDDQECVKILKQCRKAIPEKSGKVIIVDVVLDAKQENEIFKEIGLVFDLVMIAHSSGGKERTLSQWTSILQPAGFPRFNVINLPAFVSIIEAFPR